MAIDEESLRKQLIIGFEYSYLHEDWVNSLSEALEGVNAADAYERPGHHQMGIWDMVLHMSVWNENIVQRIETGEAVGPSEGHWPLRPGEPSDEAWEAAKKRLWDSLDSVRTMLEMTPYSVIEASPWGLGDLLCRFSHNAYHLGQITKLRELRGI